MQATTITNTADGASTAHALQQQVHSHRQNGRHTLPVHLISLACVLSDTHERVDPYRHTDTLPDTQRHTHKGTWTCTHIYSHRDTETHRDTLARGRRGHLPPAPHLQVLGGRGGRVRPAKVRQTADAGDEQHQAQDCQRRVLQVARGVVPQRRAQHALHGSRHRGAHPHRHQHPRVQGCTRAHTHTDVHARRRRGTHSKRAHDPTQEHMQTRKAHAGAHTSAHTRYTHVHTYKHKAHAGTISYTRHTRADTDGTKSLAHDGGHLPTGKT
jgi:hypothetical protein